MNKIIFGLLCTVALLGQNALACGKSACPANDCDKDRCDQYINRTGEFANRPVFRCIDMCAVSCSKLLEDKLDSCKKPEEEENIKKSDAEDYMEKDSDSA